MLTEAFASTDVKANLDDAIGSGNLEGGLDHDVPLNVVQIARVSLESFQKALQSNDRCTASASDCIETGTRTHAD